MTVKGSWQRPVDKEKFSQNFDKIFGTKPEKTKPEEKKDEPARKNT